MRTLRSLLLSMHRLLEKTRHGLAIGALTAALGLLGVVTGCETDDAQKTLYGPPPVEDTADASTDVPTEAVIYPDGVLYGPPPGDGVDDSAPPSDVQTDQPMVYYGPQPVDTVDDAPPPNDVSPDQPMVYYGPPPTDVVQDSVPDAPNIEVAPLYGIQPIDVVQDTQPPDVVQDCGMMTLYGPPPCDSDAACKADYGENWYCDKSEPCLPMCKPKE